MRKFAWGHTVPDPFRCLFQAIGLAFTPYEACIAMHGYGLTHWITIQLTNIFNWDAINTFLITLATSSANLQSWFAKFPWFYDRKLNRTWLLPTRSYSNFDHKTKETLQTCFRDLLMLQLLLTAHCQTGQLMEHLTRM